MTKKLKDLNVGDKVFIEHSTGWKVSVVTRFTKTLCVVENINYAGEDIGLRFDLQTGRLKGTDRWTFTYAKPFTEEHQKIVDKYIFNKRLKNVLSQLQDNLKNNLLTQEDLDKLTSIVKTDKE